VGGCRRARHCHDWSSVVSGKVSSQTFDSKTLAAHRALAEGGVAILENLVLDDVEPGRYTLVALPLRLVEADSSPVRAVLLEDES